MEAEYGPNSVDEPSLLYKLQRKIKVFNTNNTLPNRGYNLISSCSKYGIVFIISPKSTLSVYYLKDLLEKECEPQNITLSLETEPTHVAVNCDQEWLAVISKTMLFVYKIMDFQNQNISPSFSIKINNNESTFVSAVQWNPCIPDIIAIAFFDGTLLVSQVTTMQIKTLQSSARCICWSPKGKQIVTGNSDGTLCQYKPDLSLMKTIPVPKLFDGPHTEALAIYWISTYQFSVVYKNAADNTRAAVTIVNTPKGGQPFCYNYDDICYSMGTNRPCYYYLQGIAQWNLILVSSSNSMEVATLGSADGANWVQWCQTDEARAELPLTQKKLENYPVGLSIDTCAIQQLPSDENEISTPMPLLHVLSQSGLLCIFKIINLKENAAPICTAPQPLVLPANIMSSAIPDDVPHTPPAVTTTPNEQAQTAQPAPLQLVSAQPQPEPAPALSALNQFSQSFGYPNSPPYDMQKPQAHQGIFSTPHITESTTESKPQNPIAEIVAAEAQPEPVTAEALKRKSPIQTIEINAALKSEQERINKVKTDEELKNMLIKEVNDFQMELYSFMTKTRETNVKLQQDIELMAQNFQSQSHNIEQLKTDCSVEKLRESVVMLKLDLVRAYAVVAEAQTHAETKHLQDYSQADPLTAKRVASIKKLAYYVKNQIDQAYKVLDHKWDEMSARNDKPGQRMLRPILDDIYQPLVKQQGILSRQEAVLKTLSNVLKECGDLTPMFKSSSILRSTPLRSNADPLSKLTKNILNLSLEPEKNKINKPSLSNQKLEALRDMLSNRKPVKIKPVNVELRQQLEAMRLNYEKSVKEKKDKESENKIISAQKVQLEAQTMKVPIIPAMKSDNSSLKTDVQVTTVPTSTVFSNTEQTKLPFGNVARKLFTNDSEHEELSKISNIEQQEHVSNQVINKFEQKSPTQSSITVTNTTRNLLKDILQNKSQAKAEPKNDSNTFMGQNICSPTAFNFTKTTTTTAAAPSAVFPSKPITSFNNLFNNNKSLSTTELKSQLTNVNVKSSETGEPEDTEEPIKSITENIITNIFTLKSSTPLATSKSLNVPDVLKTTTTQAFTQNKVDDDNKIDVTIKVKEKGISEQNGNNPEKESEKVTKELPKFSNEKKDEPKPLGIFDKPTVPVVSATQLAEPNENVFKPEVSSSKTEVAEKTVPSMFNVSNTTTVSRPMIFGAAATQAFTVPQTTVSSTMTTTEQPTEKQKESIVTSSASSIFETQVSSQKTSTPEIKPISTGSIFSTAHNWPASSSIFGSSTSPVTTAATSSAQSLFRSAASSTFFPPSTSTTTPTTTTETSNTPTEPAVDSTPAISTTATVTPSTTTPILTATTQASTFSTSSDSTTPDPAFALTTGNQNVFNSKSTPVFGTASTTTQNLFGITTTTTSSLWSSSTEKWGFANTNQRVFGGVSTQTNLFGTPTPSTQAPLFGTPTQTTQSVFGSTTPTSQPSIFGTTVSTASTTSLFGGNEGNLFAAATISTTKAASPTSGGSIFGGSSGSSFSGGTTTNLFGRNQSAASIFGGANAAFTKQNNSDNFWSGSSNTTSSNIFGSSTFGQQPTTQASIFGGSTGGSFSAPSTGQPFSSTGEAKPSIFSTSQQQTTPAFGGSPGFGSKPVFGQSASSSTGFGSGFNKSPGGGFGAPATFGAFGGPGFGGTSPGKFFGASSPTPGFGGSTPTNPTFDSLATQNTLTFGNLAQQSAQQAQSQPNINTSPSFTGWRG